MAVSQHNNRAIKLLGYWLPVLACMLIIFSASCLPAQYLPPLFPFQDVFFHILIYAVMAYFFSRALKRTYLKLSPAKVIIFTVLFGVLYAVSDEWHQLYVPGRCASIFDLFIDGLGTLIGSLVYSWPR